MKRIEINGKGLDIINMNTFFKRLKGLMFKKDIINKAYMFEKTNGIHTFFMYQNIDVILTDKNYRIIYIKENLSKNKIILPQKGVYFTFELPLETAKYFRVGNKLDIK